MRIECSGNIIVFCIGQFVQALPRSVSEKKEHYLVLLKFLVSSVQERGILV